MEVRADHEGAPSISVVPRSSRSSIKTFQQWLTAFLSYAQSYLHFFLATAPGIIAYVTTITRFSASYPFPSVLLYDTAFRRRCAIYHPTTFWGAIDEDAREIYLTSARAAPTTTTASPSAPSTCFRCGTVGHFANTCHLPRPSSHSQPPTSPTHTMPPFRASQSNRFQAPRPSSFSFTARPTGQCFHFRAHGACSTPNCRYLHSCSHCGGLHPTSACPNPP